MTMSPPAFFFNNVFDFGADGYLDGLDLVFDDTAHTWVNSLNVMVPSRSGGGVSNDQMSDLSTYGATGTSHLDAGGNLNSYVIAGDFNQDQIPDSLTITRDLENTTSPWSLTVALSGEASKTHSSTADGDGFFTFTQPHPADAPKPKRETKRI